jgi:hypothetical protein
MRGKIGKGEGKGRGRDKGEGGKGGRDGEGGRDEGRRDGKRWGGGEG